MRGRLGGGTGKPSHTPPYPTKAGSATEGAYKTSLPCEGEVGWGHRKALPTPLPVPPRRDLRQKGIKNKIIRDKKAK